MEKDLKKVTAAQVSQETESEKKKALYKIIASKIRQIVV